MEGEVPTMAATAEQAPPPPVPVEGTATVTSGIPGPVATSISEVAATMPVAAPLGEAAVKEDEIGGNEEDDDDEDEEGTGPPRKKRGGHGRRKIEIEYIEDKIRRHITFSKRKAGISKKAYELSRLTGAQVR